MSKGFFIVDRDLLDDPLWMGSKPFTPGQAWLDLIGLANHSDRKALVRGKVIECKRGEVNRSFRNLGERWGWDKNRVSRFIKQLEKMGRVNHGTHQGETFVFLCNYCDRQDSYKKNAPQTETQTHHTRTTLAPHSHHEQIISNELENNSINSKSEKERKRAELDAWLWEIERSEILDAISTTDS